LDEVQKMAQLIDDLLLLTKLDYHPEIFVLEQVDVADFLREIYEQSKLLAAEKKITVYLNLPAEKVAIKANKLHARRMFFNLINNALKFTLPGGKVTIEGRADAGHVWVSVADSGVGISGEDLHRIFDKFFHREKAPNVESGSGLGLSIVKSIAKIHNAEVTVESMPERGSKFTVIFPRA
jgi:signal transduction histidine kinase